MYTVGSHCRYLAEYAAIYLTRAPFSASAWISFSSQMQQRQWMTSQEHLNRLKRNALKQRQQLQTMAAVESRMKKTTTAQSTNVKTQTFICQVSGLQSITLSKIQESYGLWSSVCDPAVEIIGKNREVLVQVLGALYIRGGWSAD